LAANVAPLHQTITPNSELSWFSSRVERGREGPFVEIVTVTPAIAARLLEMNDGNRPISQRLVTEIAADIEHGYWKLNGETIIVSREGLLNDGQHRLEAVVQTAIPIQSAVMFGVEREARMTVDMGRQRTSGNFLAMSGAMYSNHAAAVSRLLLLRSKGIYGRGSREKYNPTKQEIRDFYNHNEKQIKSALGDAANQRFAKIVGVTPVAAAHVLLHRANSVEAGVFFARLFDGASLKSTDAILWLRSRLMAERKNRQPGEVKFELILRHWNRWRVGVRMNRNIQREGSYPEIRP
jgi:hypothetical protein